ncbi:glycolate oxidase subunit GlcE [Pusillimonas sp. ANT_WB101]|uniref:glycolate oxidase subunit GlcE n=1 Tax=Pusillimonas sp. ANT_WB101 TaxID=2597356 RepID=UPI0011F09285|nr:glycolate oxidase subunit GlcE [Pusillimonas sp. ANT_WB101]KAA0890957.1 glycolate oxidase subunit GlcE [Pusillimonas sp. ANT_WB101]
MSPTLPLDDSARLLDEVQAALASQTPLKIRGGDSKAFLGRTAKPQANEIDTRSHCGVVEYDPTELVITVRAGTTVSALNQILTEQGQVLACEPPVFDGKATVGGMVASGLAGPRRPWAGSVRDFVLGCRIITGHGKHLAFGGQVMKNVAGYDVSRLMAGSHGCLGLLTELSLKVLPRPRAAQSLTLAVDAYSALNSLTKWRRAALPVTGACHADGVLHLRLEGGEGSVKAAVQTIGGDTLDAGFWDLLREQQLPFFEDTRPLWRLSLPTNTPVQNLPGKALLDWGGAQRWLKSDAPAEELRALAQSLGGHATCFTPPSDVEPFQPLSAPMLRYQQQLKHALDPHGIFNPGRMYASL